jgi:hypothetical protein
MHGSATLTVIPYKGDYSSSENKLVLDFADFYTFTFENLDVRGSNTGAPGSISEGYANFTVRDNGNKTGIEFAAGTDMTAYNSSRITGQFYGGNATTPSEAVGQFIVRGAGRPEYVAGAWGVMK